MWRPCWMTSLLFVLPVFMPRVAMTSSSACRCIQQTNGSMLMVVEMSEDLQQPRVTGRLLAEPALTGRQSETEQRHPFSNATLVDLTDTRFAIKVFHLTKSERVHAVVLRAPCQDLARAQHVIREKEKQLQHAITELHAVAPSTSAGAYPDSPPFCQALISNDTAVAMADLLRYHGLNRVVVIYTEEYSSLGPVIQEVLGESVLFVQRSIRSYEAIDLENALASITRSVDAVIVAAGNYSRHIIQAAQLRHLTMRRMWTVVTSQHPAHDAGWRLMLRPGAHVVLFYVTVEHRQAGADCGALWAEPSAEFSLWIQSLETEAMAKVGTWSYDGGLLLYKEDIFSFDKFSGKTFNITSLHLRFLELHSVRLAVNVGTSLQWPIFHFTKKVNGADVWTGICVEILKSIAHNLNFSYTITTPPDGNWGAPNEGNSKTWNGMIGMVQRGEVDFALAKFTVTRLRAQVIDFAVPFWQERAVIVMQKPEVDSLLVYLGPFGNELWLYLIGSVPLCALALAVVLILEDWIEVPRAEGVRSVSDQPWSYARRLVDRMGRTLMFTYQALLQQSSSWTPQTPAARFVVGFWWCFSLVIAATYTGNLIAVLAVPKVTLPVDTLEDLANQNTYKYGVVDQSALYSLFRDSTFSVYQRMWNKSIKNRQNRVGSHTEGLAKVRDERYIYLGEEGGVAPVVFKDCSYATGRERFLPASFAFAFPENSPYLPVFNKMISTLRENGVLAKWSKVYFPQNKCSGRHKGRGHTVATLNDSQGTFVVLGLGITLSLLALITELVVSICHKRRYKYRNELPSDTHHSDQDQELEMNNLAE